MKTNGTSRISYEHSTAGRGANEPIEGVDVNSGQSGNMPAAASLAIIERPTAQPKNQVHVYHPMIQPVRLHPPGIKHLHAARWMVIAMTPSKRFSLTLPGSVLLISSLFPNKSRQLSQKPRKIPRNNIMHSRSRMKMVIPNTPPFLRSVLLRKSVRCRIMEDAGEGVV